VIKGPSKEPKPGEFQYDTAVHSDAEEKRVRSVPLPFWYAKCRCYKRKKKTCLFRLQVLFVFLHPPRYLQAKYFNASLKHKNMKTKLLFVFATRIGKLSKLVKN